MWAALWLLAWPAVAPALVRTHFLEYGVALGFVFANLVGRIVTARVCHVEFAVFYYVLVPLPLLVAHSWYFGLSLWLLHAYAAFAVLSYLHFGLSIIREMTAFLRIRALVIPYPNAATSADPWRHVFPPPGKTHAK